MTLSDGGRGLRAVVFRSRPAPHDVLAPSAFRVELRPSWARPTLRSNARSMCFSPSGRGLRWAPCASDHDAARDSAHRRCQRRFAGAHSQGPLSPAGHKSLLIATTEAAQDASFQTMFRLQTKVNRVLQRPTPTSASTSWPSPSAPGPGHRQHEDGLRSFPLRPLPPRKLSADEVLARLRGKLSKIEGIATYLQSRQDVSVGGRSSRTWYQYTVQDSGPRQSFVGAPHARRNEESPSAERRRERPAKRGIGLDLDIDRDTASRLGVTAAAVDQALYDAYGQRFVATTFTQLNEVP